jgi:hypothetical protein
MQQSLPDPFFGRGAEAITFFGTGTVLFQNKVEASAIPAAFFGLVTYGILLAISGVVSVLRRKGDGSDDPGST